MKRLLRLRDWSVRAKLAALLIAASLAPLALSAYLDLHVERGHRIRDMQGLLAARGEQLAREFDSIHTGYLRSTQRVAFQPAIGEFCSAPAGDRAAPGARLEGIFATFPKSDPQIRGMALIDGTGRVAVATDKPTLGMDLSSRATVREAMQGKPVISDVYVSTASGGELPTVAYLVPVPDATGNVLCLVALWVHADAFWRVQRAANERAGPNSFAVLYDRYGIRIGHSFRQEIVFRPGGALEPVVLEELVATRRFGDRTRELLQDVRSFPAQFERARAAVPDTQAFRGFATANGTWNYGVASRLKTVHWTIFYMMPEATLLRDLDQITRDKALLALGFIIVSAAVGVAFATTILKPVDALGKATVALSTGDPGARVAQTGSDELGRLAASFNAMAATIQAQAADLRRSHDELRRYADELEVSNKDLEAFAFSVSHDLRAPLHVVDGFSKALAAKYAGQLDSGAAHYLGRIRAGVLQMEQLVDGILRLSRIGRKPLDKRPVDLNVLVNEVLEELRQQHALAHHQVHVSGGLGEVMADRVLLRQVYANLLSNACKFSARQPQPEITIGCEAAGGERIYFVRDNGTGFDTAHAARLFEPFQRLHDASEYDGLGVGLSIVQRIVNRHGGRIWVEATAGRGACFYFTMESRAHP